jgi:alpha-tubulin suppressor-like RCC1 family protein
LIKGDNYDGQTTIPKGLANVVAIAAGSAYTIALKSDGTVTTWGRNNYDQTTIPGGVANVAALTAGGFGVG